MTMIKNRINISVSREVEQVVASLAKRDQVPNATKAAELIRLALEIEEDQVLDTFAERRDKTATKFVSHKTAWA